MLQSKSLACQEVWVSLMDVGPLEDCGAQSGQYAQSCSGHAKAGMLQAWRPQPLPVAGCHWAPGVYSTYAPGWGSVGALLAKGALHGPFKPCRLGCSS